MRKVTKEKDKEYASRYRNKNREAIRARMNAWNKANKDKRKHYALKEKYDLSLEEYNQMLSDQGGCCKICNRHSSLFKKALNVDHCHKTGKIRGLLCKDCNLLLGKVRDDISVLEKAITYLKDDSE